MEEDDDLQDQNRAKGESQKQKGSQVSWITHQSPILPPLNLPHLMRHKKDYESADRVQKTALGITQGKKTCIISRSINSELTDTQVTKFQV